MQRTVSAQAARQRLGELLEGVFYRGDEVVIERAGKPMGVVISPQRYAAWDAKRQAARERIGKAIDEIRAANMDVDPEQVERDVEAAIQAGRRQRRARAEAAGRSPSEVAEPIPAKA